MNNLHDLKQALQEKQEAALAAIQSTTDLTALEQLRVNYLGKKSELTEVLKSLGNLPPEDRPLMGQAMNEVKQTITDALGTKKNSLGKISFCR